MSPIKVSLFLFPNSFFYLENTFCVYTTYPESIPFYFFPAADILFILPPQKKGEKQNEKEIFPSDYLRAFFVC